MSMYVRIYILRDRINILYDLNIEPVSELKEVLGSTSVGGAIYFTEKLINL